MSKGREALLGPGSGQALRLARLAQAFCTFRGSHRLRTRVPEGLRTQALQAVDAGVSPQAIFKACRVTGEQLARWRAVRGRAGVGRDELPGAQVLRVVEPEDGAASRTEDVRLEVTMGAWRLSLHVRPAREGDSGPWCR